MDFFGVGPPELLIILLITLLVVGPSRLAETARTLGKWVRELRKLGSEFTQNLTQEEEREERKSGGQRGQR